MAIVTNKTSIKLNRLEESTLNIIKRLLKKHETFQFNPIFIELCCHELKASEMEIYKAIYSLLQQKIIVQGSTLTRDQILENQSRALIFETIQNQPGIHIRELFMQVKLCSNVVRTHIKVLEKFNYIRRKKYISPKLTLLFRKDFPELYDDFFVITKNENDLLITQRLLNQNLSVTELSNALELHHSTIQYHLKKLEQLGLIIEIQEDNTNKYTFNIAKLNDFKEFNIKFLKNSSIKLNFKISN